MMNERAYIPTPGTGLNGREEEVCKRFGLLLENLPLVTKEFDGNITGRSITITNLYTDIRAAMPTTNYSRTLGKKRYEMVNHLGNVLATISDRKLPVDDNADNTIDYYTADAINAQMYYAFGAPLEGKKWTVTGGDGYRYGFNGKEKETEVNGDDYDFGERIYDARVGRWLSVDREFYTSPGVTPFAFVKNSPIGLIDPQGNSEKVAITSIKEEKYGKNLCLVVEGTITIKLKILNLSSKALDMSQLKNDIKEKGEATFSGYGQIGGESGGFKMAFDQNGLLVNKNYSMGLKATVSVKIEVEVVYSLADLKKGDNALIYVNNIPKRPSGLDPGGITNGVGGNVALVEADQDLSTAIHELGHEFGLEDEYKDVNGKVTDNHPNNVMGAGYSFSINFLQLGKIMQQALLLNAAEKYMKKDLGGNAANAQSDATNFINKTGTK